MIEEQLKALDARETVAERTASPMETVITDLGRDIEKLGSIVQKLESRLATVLAEPNPRPEEAPSAPPGTSSAVYALGSMRNHLGVVAGELLSVLGRLEV